MNQRFEPNRPIQNLVVAKYRSGKMIKGVTYNFGPEKKIFHVIPFMEGKEERVKKGVEVVISELKAIFFVRSLEGKKEPRSLGDLLEEEEDEQTMTMKVKVVFHDGETIVGLTHGYSSDKQGFFLIPLEKESNNLRVFVVFDSTKEIAVLK